MNRLLHLILLISACVLSAQTPKVLFSVQPNYPPLSRMAQLGGVVELDIILNPDGSVKSALPVKNQERWKQLDYCSIDAARQWKFEPSNNLKTKITFVYHLYPKGTPDERMQPEFLNATTMIVSATVIYVDKTPIIDPKSE